MNERISVLTKNFAESLLQRSGLDVREYEPFLEETEKFAELIVRECADQVFRKEEAMSILKHFGVEE